MEFCRGVEPGVHGRVYAASYWRKIVPFVKLTTVSSECVARNQFTFYPKGKATCMTSTTICHLTKHLYEINNYADAF